MYEAESLSVGSFIEWRGHAGLEEMALIGPRLARTSESDQRYLCAAISGRVHRLTLLSPTGVPHDPNIMVSSREMLDRQVTGGRIRSCGQLAAGGAGAGTACGEK